MFFSKAHLWYSRSLANTKGVAMRFLIWILFFSQAHLFALQDDTVEQKTKEAASQGYHIEFIELVELIYGKGFLSQGGEASVKRMVANVDLNGKKVLDIGSGLGGPALYLAEHYTAEITGLEPQAWMVERANESLKSIQSKLKGRVDFVHMTTASSLKSFESNSFDVVISKEALLHIPQEAKQPFFDEIYRVLKPSGQIIIMDWMKTSQDYSEKTKKMMEMDGVAYNLIDQADYLKILTNAHFQQITFENTTRDQAAISKQNVETIESLKDTICKKYSLEVYEDSLLSWSLQQAAFQSGELQTAIIRAKK